MLHVADDPSHSPSLSSSNRQHQCRLRKSTAMLSRYAEYKCNQFFRFGPHLDVSKSSEVSESESYCDESSIASGDDSSLPSSSVSSFLLSRVTSLEQSVSSVEANSHASFSDSNSSCWTSSAADSDSSVESDSESDYSASSYSSSCTETTLTPSTMSSKGAKSLEIRWCQIDHVIAHPLMAALLTSAAMQKNDSYHSLSRQCLRLTAVDGRTVVRLQNTLALSQKSYLMDFALPPRVFVLGLDIDWRSEDDCEEWWDVLENTSGAPFYDHASALGQFDV